MKNLRFKRFLFFFIVIFGVICQNSFFVFGSQSNQQQSKQAFQTSLKEKFQQLKLEYIRLKKQGYDLTEVNRMIKEFRTALQEKDRARARELLGKIQSVLNKIEKREPLEFSDDELIPPSMASPPQVGVPVNVRDFALGVEYLPMLPVAEIYGKTGVKWAKSAGIEWNLIEPEPPDKKGNRFYRWELLDKVILEWQRAGIVHLQLWLKCTAKWATRNVSTHTRSLTRRASSPPKKGHWDDYAEFIRNIVERYDKDGRDDAPGLLYPVEHFQIEAEAQHHGQWQGTVNEYLKLLETAYKAAKKANPHSKIILSGFTFLDLLDDMPSRETLLKRVKNMRTLGDSFAFNSKILSRPDIFDQVAFNYLTDYKAIYGCTGWIRAQMRKYGYEKPIWASDAFSGLLIYHSDLNTPFPSRATREKLFQALTNGRNRDYHGVINWFRTNQSVVMAKKILVSMETGLIGINIGNTKDWTAAWKLDSHYQKSTAPMGLVDLEVRGNKIVSWQGRPAYYTLKFLVSTLKDVNEIARLTAPEGIYAYKITMKGKPLFAMWFDDNKEHLPGEDMGQTTVSLRTNSNTIQITSVVIDCGIEKPEWRSLFAKGETFTFSLSEIPLFIEGIEELTFVSEL